MKRVPLVLVLALALCGRAFGFDDAEILAARVPNQRYIFAGEWGGALRKGDAIWGIPLWATDPATLTIHTTNLKYAPYAVRIVTLHNAPIVQNDSYRRLDAIHLLAMSKEDALRMRKALIAEIAMTQALVEKRQGNRPGFLKEKARARK